MRRYLRKPREMRTREFNTRLQELNLYLSKFPPFGGDAQKLDKDDLVEILEFAVPARWQKDMLYQGFNASEHTATKVVKFCECLEFTEMLSDSVKGKNSQSNLKVAKSKNCKSGEKSSEEASKSTHSGTKRGRDKQYCPLHDTDSHDISECKVMLNQAKKSKNCGKIGPQTPKRTTKRKKNSIPLLPKPSSKP